MLKHPSHPTPHLILSNPTLPHHLVVRLNKPPTPPPTVLPTPMATTTLLLQLDSNSNDAPFPILNHHHPPYTASYIQERGISHPFASRKEEKKKKRKKEKRKKKGERGGGGVPNTGIKKIKMHRHARNTSNRNREICIYISLSQHARPSLQLVGPRFRKRYRLATPSFAG